MIEWFRNTPSFSMSISFILKSGITRRDVSNCDKALIDTITRYIRDDLEVETFDDSLFSDVHFYKSVIPGASQEYCCVSIKESTHNLRFDEIPKPEKVWINLETIQYPELPKKIKKGMKPIVKAESKDDADTRVYYCELNNNFIDFISKIPEYLLDAFSTSQKQYGFVLVAIKKQEGFETWNKDILNMYSDFVDRIKEYETIYSGVMFREIENPEDIWNYLKT